MNNGKVEPMNKSQLELRLALGVFVLLLIVAGMMVR